MGKDEQDWSTLPAEVQRAIVLWLPSLATLARVNRSWHANVLFSIECAKDEFWNSAFDVGWLVLEEGRKLILNPEPRVLMKLQKYRVTGSLTYWWYNVQLHLRVFCQRYPGVHAAFPTPRVIFDLCYRNSVCQRRSCRELFPEVFQLHAVLSLPYSRFMHVPINAAIFGVNNFVETRDLGCWHLDTSVKEVLGTLLCMLQDNEFCECHWDRCPIDMRTYGFYTQMRPRRRGGPGGNGRFE
jgi:hypothetical protein